MRSCSGRSTRRPTGCFGKRRLRRGPDAGGEVTPAQRRADALGLLAEAALAADLDRGTAGDRYQVVLHVEAPAAGAGAHRFAGPGGGRRRVHVSAETSRRLACDAAVVRMHHDADG